MEIKYKNFIKNVMGSIFNFIFIIGILGCASNIKYDKVESLKKIDEFDKQVKIVSMEEPPNRIQAPTKHKLKKTSEIAKQKNKRISKKIRKNKKIPRKQPYLESDIGFIGRRPAVDPFKVGERVVHKVTYLGLNAGSLAIEVKPYAKVNERKSYQFQMNIWTSSLFSKIYTVEDSVICLSDFESLVPSIFTLHVKESGQLREARALYDRKKKTATFWEKKVTKNEGEKEKKIEWDILDYSQNVYSAIYYLRTFQWDVGTENAFRVADDGENLVFKAKAIRREKLKTDIGEFNTIVLKPEVQLKGIAKPVGDIYMWLSDDDRKFLLRIEAKVKIGSLVSEVVELSPGHD